MKCPMCLGKGYATDEDIKEYPHRCPNCNGKGFYSVDWQKVRCEVCNGSGKKLMTEQEYLQTCNTEQLAEWINNIVDDGIIKAWMIKNNCCGDYLESVKWWLKQQHTKE